MQELHATLLDLAERRAELAAATEQLALRRQQFDADNATLIAHTKVIAERVEEVEQTVRRLALAEYAATGTKTPAPGVAVKVGTRVSYDAQKALTWCLMNASALIVRTLNEKGFKAMASGLAPDDLKAFDYVETAEPKATIATDLDAAPALQEAA